MRKMKTLTVNGQQYTIEDPDGVSYGESQSLTDEQKATARANIDAAAKGDGTKVAITTEAVSNGTQVNITTTEQENGVTHTQVQSIVVHDGADGVSITSAEVTMLDAESAPTAELVAATPLPGEKEKILKLGIPGTNEAVQNISADLVAVNPHALQTEQDGYLHKEGHYSSTSIYHSITTQKIPCKQGDVFVYDGRSGAQAVGWFFYTDDEIVSYGQKTGQAEVAVPQGVNYVRFSSFAEKENEVSLTVYKKTSPQTEELTAFAEGFLDMEVQQMIYNAQEYVGYYGGSDQIVDSSNHHCMVTEKIPCHEGDAFIYKGRGRASARSWYFYHDDTVVDKGQYVGETVVTIPEGVNYVRFSSFALTDEEIVFEVCKCNSPQVKKLYELVDRANKSNVLWGKKYVAAGDSFTAGAFSGFVDENGLSGTSSPVIYDSVKGMYKTYPWWIGERNHMTVIDHGKSGSTMPLSTNYINGEEDITVRNPYSYERYLSVPEDADYMTIWFGINDCYSTELGTVDDTTNETFYGAYNVVLQWLLVNRPRLKIGLIVTTGARAPYRQAVRDIGKRWGIPVLDMMGEETPTLFDKENGLCETAQQIYRNKFGVSADNGHPGILAHENMSTYIEAFLRRL